MFIQRSRSSNPYAAYQALLEQRGLLGERQRALNEPSLRVSELAAPALKSQLFANAQRYERLGGNLTSLLPALGELADPGAGLLIRRARVQFTRPAAADETGTATPARAASLIGASALSLNAGTPATTATLRAQAPRLRLDSATPATAATLTLGKVALNTSQMTTAELRGANIALPKKATEADFGAITINGVTTTLGVYATQDERAAALFVVDRLNANPENTVTAALDRDGKRVVLTAKSPGTAGNITIDRITADSDGNGANDVSTGFRTGATASGRDDGTSDFGSVTINGVTTTFGVRTNGLQSPQSATEWLVERLNANQANDFTATVGGADRDQIVLTSKSLGSQSRLAIDAVTPDSDGATGNAATTGFVAGLSAQGQDADLGVTDLGSVTINGVTTTFGTLENAGQSSSSAARFMVERLNANAANPVVASLDPDGDEILLSAKTPGSAGSFRIEAVASDSNGSSGDDGFNGWVASRSATGRDATSALTDFGALTINGITTEFGVLDSRLHTTQSAMQYLLDRLNQTNSTLTATAENGRIRISSKEAGDRAELAIDAATPDSDGDPTNDRGLGFAAGSRAVGADAGSAGKAAARPIETVFETLVDPAQLTRLTDRAGQFAQHLNQYLQGLQDDRQALPRSIRAYGAELTRPLREDAERFERLGLRLKDDRLEVDAAALEQAFKEDPQATAGVFRRLQETLEQNVGAQAFALDQMRSVSQATSESAATMSQVAASIYKIQHRAKKLSWLMEQLEPAKASLDEQNERLKRLSAEKPDAKKAKQDERDERTAPESELDRQQAGFGLLRSPVPEGFFPEGPPNRGLAPQWPFGR